MHPNQIQSLGANHEQFPMQYLPINLVNVLWNAHTEVQCPMSAGALAAFSIMSLSASGRISVRDAANQTTPVSMYYFSIQDSGERKTTTLNLFQRGVLRFMGGRAEKFEKEFSAYSARHASWKTQRSAICKEIEKCSVKNTDIGELEERLVSHIQAEPKPPRRIRLIHEDSTAEALRNNLASGYPITSLLSDEGFSIFKSGSISDVGLLNSSWDGRRIEVDRASMSPLVMDDPAISLYIAVQQRVFQEYLKKKGDVARSSGLFSRSYAIAPPIMAGTRRLTRGSDGAKCMDWFNDRCVEVLNDIFEGNGDVKERLVVEFSPEASVIWENEFGYIEQAMASGGWLSNHRDFGSKQLNKISRLAATIEYFCLGNVVVGLDAMKAAINICRWLLAQTLQVFPGENSLSELEEDARDLYQWLLDGYQKTGAIAVTRSYALQYGPRRLRRKDRLASVVYLLNQRGLAFESRSTPKGVSCIQIALYSSQNQI